MKAGRLRLARGVTPQVLGRGLPPPPKKNRPSWTPPPHCPPDPPFPPPHPAPVGLRPAVSGWGSPKGVPPCRAAMPSCMSQRMRACPKRAGVKVAGRNRARVSLCVRLVGGSEAGSCICSANLQATLRWRGATACAAIPCSCWLSTGTTPGGTCGCHLQPPPMGAWSPMSLLAPNLYTWVWLLRMRGECIGLHVSARDAVEQDSHVPAMKRGNPCTTLRVLVTFHSPPTPEAAPALPQAALALSGTVVPAARQFGRAGGKGQEWLACRGKCA